MNTPTDDEREALDYAIRCAIPTDLDYRPVWKLIRAIQDSVIAAGFRHTEVQPRVAASARCECSCHSMPGVSHIAPCCSTVAWFSRRDEVQPRGDIRHTEEPMHLTVSHDQPPKYLLDGAPSEPQGEPSDAQVEAAALVVAQAHGWNTAGIHDRDTARAALRAAGRVQ